MSDDIHEEEQLRTVALANAKSILVVHKRAEQDLIEAKEALQRKTDELVHSLALMRATLNSTTDGFLVLDEDGQIADFNRKLIEMWRIPPAVFSSRDMGLLRDFISGAIRAPLPFDLGNLSNFDAVGNSQLLELKDGRLFEQFSQDQRIENRITGRVLCFRDVTERKQAEEIFSRLAAVVESSDDAIISKSLEGIITSWNTGAERIFGYKAEEIVGKSILTLIPPELQKEEPGIIARLKKGERIEHYETVRLAKDGRPINISLSVSPIKDGSGKIIGASKIARDITKDKLRQDELRESEVRFRTLADAAPMLIWEAGTDKLCNYFNQTWLKFVGRTLEQELGNGWMENMHPDDFDRCLQIYSSSFDARVPFEMEYRVRHHSGEYRWLLDKGTPRFGPRGTFQGYIGACVDITESVQAKQSSVERREELERLVNERTSSLQEAIAQMEEFSYSVSHDLRAPLRAMQGYATALLEDYRGKVIDDEAQDYLQRIVGAGHRMDRLTRDVLVYSKIPRATAPLHPVGLDKLVSDIVQQNLPAKTKDANVWVEKPLLAVLGNDAFLAQSISNLVDNAVKFAAKNRPLKIRIWTERHQGQVRLWVEDNGIGILPEHQSRVWGMFERIHPQDMYEGTGIGLAIVRKTIERMNGTMGVMSDGATGSKFWIQLPGIQQKYESLF